jgi:cyclase
MMRRWLSAVVVRRFGRFLFPLGAGLIAAWLMAPGLLPAESPSTSQRTVTNLARGIYLIQHKDAPDHFPQGNTVVIIGDAEVLVVDSCYLPSSAREDIAQIRKWADKPVRYLLNTHWHNDHNQGNAVYSDAFPALAIVAQSETAKMMALRVATYLSEYPHRMELFQQEIDSGKYPSGAPLTQSELDDLENAVKGGKAASDAVSAEFLGLKVKLPDLTFDHELDIDLGNREVQLKYLGRGNTVGDVIAYLPKERILIAGDLVDSPVPYLGGGFPIEQVATLKRLKEVDFETLIPGHGGVLKGKAFVQQEIDLMETVIAAMNQEIGRTNADPHRRFDEIKKAVERTVDVNAWRQKFAGDDPNDQQFFEVFSWPGLLEAAHAEMWPR